METLDGQQTEGIKIEAGRMSTIPTATDPQQNQQSAPNSNDFSDREKEYQQLAKAIWAEETLAWREKIAASNHDPRWLDANWAFNHQARREQEK